MDEYLTPRQAAERRGVSVSTIYRAIERGEIPALRLLSRLALRAADVDAYQPGSYNGIQRATRRRGPGRSRKTETAPTQAEET